MVRTALATAILLIAASVSADTATVTAIHATRTGAAETAYDARSRAYEELLEPLEFDAFQTVKQDKIQLAADRDTEVRINERYTLRLGPAESQSDGHIKCRAEVYGLPRNAKEPVKVLEMTLRLAPQKPVMIRGLRMDEGEIIALIERN